MKVAISPHPQQSLLLFFFLNFSHSSRCEVITVVLICISEMTNDVEYFFICLLAICLS